MHERDILKIKAIRSQNPIDWQIFKTCRNSVNNEVKSVKAAYFKNAIFESKGNMRNTWKVINELTSRKSRNSSIRNVKDSAGGSIHDSTEMGNAFNRHFSSIGPSLANDIPESTKHFSDYLIVTSENIFQLAPTNSHRVFTLLSKLDKSKATGLDKISARLVRECVDLIATPLSLIFNKSIASGIFPEEWKHSKVIPLFKKGGSIRC